MRPPSRLRNWSGGEGGLYIGKAQEKARVLRTERRRRPSIGATYAWLVSSTAMVNHFYFYAVDDDFGPFFLKFCSYFPYNAKLCTNGHEYLKRQLAKRGIAFEPLDNGILRCADPEAMQRLADGLTAERIDALLRKWLARLPHPVFVQRPRAGHPLRHLDAAGRIRAHPGLRPAGGRTGLLRGGDARDLDMGRPDHVQLIFDRRVSRRTPTRHRTRVITDGVIPSLHVNYKHSRIKQYHNEGRALRTETVINDTYDFDVDRRLRAVRRRAGVGWQRRRSVSDHRGSLSHDCTIGAETLSALHRPALVDGQRASTLRFGDPRVQALLAALLRFDLLPAGFRNRQLRVAVAPLRGMSLDDYNAGQMTYDLRRLRLRGLIERIPHSRQAAQERLVAFARVPVDDAPQRRVRFQRPRVDADRLPLEQAGVRQTLCSAPF